jgi:TATA-box binding protein (TBP) (component of TFIID and TFIIIB)
MVAAANVAVRATFGARAGDPSMVSSSSMPSGIAVRRRGAGDALGRVELGAVVFPDALPGVDAFVFALPEQRDTDEDDDSTQPGPAVEELLLVREPTAELTYDLDLPVGHRLHQTGGAEVVEVRDADDVARLRFRAARAWDARGTPIDVRLVVESSSIHVALPAQPAAMYPLLVDPSWESTGGMVVVRSHAAATLLSSGKVLVTGGHAPLIGYQSTAELYDPRTGTWSAGADMGTTRSWHTATVLRSGKVLIAGGFGAGGHTASAELYDPKTGIYTATGNLLQARAQHVATLLPSGKVLVCAGEGAAGPLASAELFDPDASNGAGAFVATAPLATPRLGPAAARLQSGRVLVTGGEGMAGAAVASAELFDPSGNAGAGSFTSAGSMSVGRTRLTATLMGNGQVLVAGGKTPTTAHASAERFDPTANGGSGGFLPAASMASARSWPGAALMPDGKVLVIGGRDGPSAHATTELYDPTADAFTPGPDLVVVREHFTATMLPSGRLLLVGGPITTLAELFDPLGGGGTGSFVPAGSSSAARQWHTSTLLPSGKVLIAGGDDQNDVPSATAELWDPDAPPAAGPSSTGSLLTARSRHTAALLPSGKVLIVGGIGPGGSVLSSAEVYDPAAGTFTATGAMTGKRIIPSATLLSSGRVLVAGGFEAASPLPTAELFDESANGGVGAFVPAANMQSGHGGHAAALLASGKVLIIGDVLLNASELYVPATDGGPGSFAPTGAMSQQRLSPSATLLPSGKVLVAGGSNGPLAQQSAEVYDPNAAGGAFSPTGPMASARVAHSATLLPSGKVLLAGGCSGAACTSIAGAELYDPYAGAGMGAFLPTGALAVARSAHGATMLASGEVLVTGGKGSANVSIASAERWSDGLVPPPGARPVISTAPSVVTAGQTAQIAGVGFAGVSEASSGTMYASSTSFPFALWLPAAGGTTFGVVGAWSPTSASWTPPATSLVGPGWLFVSVNGVVSKGAPVRLTAAPVGTACGAGPACSSGFCVDGVCCAEACSGACVACSAAKKSSGADDGSCGPIAAGTDPDADCPTSSVTTCQETGVCDGAGQCALYPTGTLCVQAFCSAGVVLTPAFTCNGTGTCVATPITNCSPFVCEGEGASAGCSTSCASSQDCGPGAFCAAGECLEPQPNGEACTSPLECESGLCVDGRCCNAECGGQCEACDEPGNLGVCSAVDGDPHGDRDPCLNAGEECGGRCNGVLTFSCSYKSTATPCGASTCTDGVAVQAHCTGTGSCGAPVEVPCINFACGETACKTSCSSDDDCDPRFFCTDAGDCEPRTETLCDGDHTLISASGFEQSCSPFKCTEANACLSSCASNADCVDGFECSAEGQCEAPPLWRTESGCSCRAAGSGDHRDEPLWLAAGASMALFFARRRRQRRHRRVG